MVIKSFKGYVAAKDDLLAVATMLVKFGYSVSLIKIQAGKSRQEYALEVKEPE